jgi:hypothetical protein
MKSNYFWFLCASLLILLLGVFLHQGLHKKNFVFTVWLAGGCVACFIAYVGLALGRPYWFDTARQCSNAISAGLALAAISFGIARWSCPVNRTIVYGLAGMLAAQLFGILMVQANLGGQAQGLPLRAWLQNIGFFGPMLWMLAVFSGARFDRLMALVAQWRVTSGEWRVAGEAARRIIGA